MICGTERVDVLSRPHGLASTVISSKWRREIVVPNSAAPQGTRQILAETRQACSVDRLAGMLPAAIGAMPQRGSSSQCRPRGEQTQIARPTIFPG
jgi:hypothetical protein